MNNILIDFDGVIHQEQNNNNCPTVIYGPMIEGADEAIAILRKFYKVIIFSVRARTKSGKDAIADWLNENNIVVDGITNRKAEADAYIDDKAVVFTNWEDIIYKFDHD